jgi:hypothetical protein
MGMDAARVVIVTIDLHRVKGLAIAFFNPLCEGLRKSGIGPEEVMRYSGGTQELYACRGPH